MDVYISDSFPNKAFSSFLLKKLLKVFTLNLGVPRYSKVKMTLSLFNFPHLWFRFQTCARTYMPVIWHLKG